MAIKRLTKDDAPLSFGTFNPVGHVVVAFPDDNSAQQAAQELRQAGFEDEDILHFSPDEESERMGQMLDGITGTAEFGHEIVLMREYKQLADEGCGWLIVYAPEKERCEKVVEVARRHGAKLAEKYGRIVIEDLL
jgi:tRNA A58 N-methylase Trm61